MKIKWVKSCEIEVATGLRRNTVIESRDIGDVDDVEIIGYGTTTTTPDDRRFPQLQFGDGSITMCVSSDWFETITEPEH